MGQRQAEGVREDDRVGVVVPEGDVLWEEVPARALLGEFVGEVETVTEWVGLTEGVPPPTARDGEAEDVFDTLGLAEDVSVKVGLVARVTN